jgi:hypothetical protein
MAVIPLWEAATANAVTTPRAGVADVFGGRLRPLGRFNNKFCFFDASGRYRATENGFPKRKLVALFDGDEAFLCRTFPEERCGKIVAHSFNTIHVNFAIAAACGGRVFWQPPIRTWLLRPEMFDRDGCFLGAPGVCASRRRERPAAAAPAVGPAASQPPRLVPRALRAYRRAHEIQKRRASLRVVGPSQTDPRPG